MKQVKKIFNILGICFLVIICYTSVVGMGKAETVPLQQPLRFEQKLIQYKQDLIEADTITDKFYEIVGKDIFLQDEQFYLNSINYVDTALNLLQQYYQNKFKNYEDETNQLFEIVSISGDSRAATLLLNIAIDTSIIADFRGIALIYLRFFNPYFPFNDLNSMKIFIDNNVFNQLNNLINQGKTFDDLSAKLLWEFGYDTVELENKIYELLINNKLDIWSFFTYYSWATKKTFINKNGFMLLKKIVKEGSLENKKIAEKILKMAGIDI